MVTLVNRKLQLTKSESKQLVLPDSFIKKISAHGELVDVIMDITLKWYCSSHRKFSASLITYHVCTQDSFFNPKQ